MQLYGASMTKLLPALESIIEITVCGGKTDCNSNRCKMKKNEGLE